MTAPVALDVNSRADLVAAVQHAKSASVRAFYQTGHGSPTLAAAYIAAQAALDQYDSKLAGPSITDILASAKAFRLAIDALPLGRDLRARLHGHLDRHIETIEAAQ